MGDFEDLAGQIDFLRCKELEGLIRRAREAYYNPRATTPPEDIVSDAVFDAWRAELKELDASSPGVTAIGAPVPDDSPWVKVAHDIPMGSLDKVNTPEEFIKDWLLKAVPSWTPKGSEQPELFETEKLDGLSLNVRYVKGVFTQALTRGDGVTGQDITRNVAKMKGILPRIPDSKFTGSLRGEIVLLKEDYKTHFPTYKNTRAAAAGITNRLDGEGPEHLTVLFYNVADGLDAPTEEAQFKWLEANGFKTPRWQIVTMVGGTTPSSIWTEYQQSIRETLPYDIDGLVFRLNDMAQQLALGDVDGTPKGAVAFKFAAIARVTTIRGFQLQVGGMGHITPVAVFDSVDLLGSDVTNASCYNFRYIQELGLDVGAEVMVAKANDVIPRVVSCVTPTGTTLTPPKACPACGAVTEMDGEYLTCPNSAECPAQAIGRLKRYVKVHDLLGWGEGLLERLVETGAAKSVPDLYRLTAERLAAIDRMGVKSAEKVLKTLWAKTSLRIEDLLGSLSIPLCGPDTIEKLTKAKLTTLAKMRAATQEELEGINGIGPVKAHVLYHWIQNDSPIIEELDALGLKISDEINGPLSGFSFCFTGSSVMPRGELIEITKGAGGKVKSGVSKDLSYLVMADAKSNSGKAQAARKNGTKCLSEEDFLKMAEYVASETGPTLTAPMGSLDVDVSLVDGV